MPVQVLLSAVADRLLEGNGIVMVAGRGVGAPLRQQRIPNALVGRIADLDGLDGAIVIGSLASDVADAASDIDLFLCVRPGRFDEAWNQRHRLHVTGALVAWDEHSEPEIGAHRWVTNHLVLVETLFATPTSGARLAPPWRVLVGRLDLADRFPHRPRSIAVRCVAKDRTQ